MVRLSPAVQGRNSNVGIRLETVTRTSGANVSWPAITDHSTTGIASECSILQSALSGDSQSVKACSDGRLPQQAGVFIHLLALMYAAAKASRALELKSSPIMSRSPMDDFGVTRSSAIFLSKAPASSATRASARR